MKIVIMAGGQGTRFWPLSRESCPKQFLKIAGNQTMLQETIARLSPLVGPEDVHVVCGRGYVDLVRQQLPGLEEGQLIVEPMPRNTAPCIGLAALALRRRFGNTVMAVLPADHCINRVGEFHDALQTATQLAGEGWLVTFGIEPAYPATGYGYIHRAEAIGEYRGKTCFRVERFVEKPDAERAQEFLKTGEYYWNSGMFVWTVDTIMDQFRRHMPELYDILVEIDCQPSDAGKLEQLFDRAPRLSIDFGVMEKAEQVATIPCRLGWSDVGNWRAAGELMEEDADRIASNTSYVQHESRDCLLHSASGKLIALLGVEGLVVVETPDAVLVCRRDRAEEVKQIVEKLRRDGPREYL